MLELKAPGVGPYILSAEELRLIEKMREKLALRLVGCQQREWKRVRMRRKRRGSRCPFYHIIVRVVADVE